MNSYPIGIFDSGIGGLTIANAIKKILPNESIIYFGDTEHLPYGEKSNESIITFSKYITKFLINCQLYFCTFGDQWVVLPSSNVHFSSSALHIIFSYIYSFLSGMIFLLICFSRYALNTL